MQAEQILGKSFTLPYITFWLAIVIVFDALFLMSPDADLGLAFKAGMQIIGMAALLGLGVLHFALRSPMPQDNLFLCLMMNVVAALIYTLFWIVGVMLIGSVEQLFTNGILQFKIPSGFALRWHLLAGPVLYVAITTAVFSVRSFQQSQLALKNAELQALRAKLNPHFLFNTLHTIMMLFRIDADKAEKAIEQFSDLIRYSFHNEQHSLTANHGALVSLKNEWVIAQKYLDLEKLRLGEKLRLTTSIEEQALEFWAPPLLLQPLLENAVVHAASCHENGADIHVEMNCLENQVLIKIKNNGADAEVSNTRTTSGLGLKAVQAGLSNAFGKQANLTIESNSSGLFEVRVIVPAQKAVD